MKRSTARWSTALVAAALLALPVSSVAQTPGSQQPVAQQPTTQPPTTEQPNVGAQPQVDEQAAKRHLTAARNSLSELTQLPAAAQLTGEARTQVSQLISNFNELITTDTEWRASYDKVAANVTALIGSPMTDEPQTPPSTTPGAVGTTGSAASGLDPAIRQKLVEFRAHLLEFEKAAGGGSPSSESAPSSTANPRSMTDPSSTANPTGSAYPSSPSTSTPGTTPEQSAGAAQRSSQPQQPSEQQGHSEAMRHIAAIESILSGQPGASSPSTPSPTGTTGAATGAPVTLDRAQIEQIRMHLAELRKLLDRADRQ